jgi:hypothetical protein
MGLGSGKKPIPDPGSRGQIGTGSATLGFLRGRFNSLCTGIEYAADSFPDPEVLLKVKKNLLKSYPGPAVSKFRIRKFQSPL